MIGRRVFSREYFIMKFWENNIPFSRSTSMTNTELHFSQRHLTMLACIIILHVTSNLPTGSTSESFFNQSNASNITTYTQ